MHQPTGGSSRNLVGKGWLLRIGSAQCFDPQDASVDHDDEGLADGSGQIGAAYVIGTHVDVDWLNSEEASRKLGQVSRYAVVFKP